MKKARARITRRMMARLVGDSARVVRGAKLHSGRRTTAELAREANERAAWLCRMTGLEWSSEYRFCQSRRSRFDFACFSIMTAIEIEGGVWGFKCNETGERIMGRHSRGVGMVSDMEKYNRAQLLGWIVLRYTPEQFGRGDWLVDVEAAKRRCERDE